MIKYAIFNARSLKTRRKDMKKIILATLLLFSLFGKAKAMDNPYLKVSFSVREFGKTMLVCDLARQTTGREILNAFGDGIDQYSIVTSGPEETQKFIRLMVNKNIRYMKNGFMSGNFFLIQEDGVKFVIGIYIHGEHWRAYKLSLNSSSLRQLVSDGRFFLPV